MFLENEKRQVQICFCHIKISKANRILYTLNHPCNRSVTDLSCSLVPTTSSSKLSLLGVYLMALIDPITVDIDGGTQMVNPTTVLSRAYPTLQATDTAISLTKGQVTELRESDDWTTEWVYLHLDLDAERVVAERAVEDGFELGLGLWGLYLC